MQGLGMLPPDVQMRIAHLRQRADLRVDFTPGSLARPLADQPWRRCWRFASESAAARWNELWERVLDVPGSLHPALIEVAGRSIRDPLLDVLARLAATVLCDEIGRGTPYPFVRPGGSYALEIAAHCQPFPIPRFAHSLVVSVRGEVFDPRGESLWSSHAVREIPFELVPESVAAQWAERAFPPTDETWD